MSYTNTTKNLKLPQYLGQDKPAWLTDVNETNRLIDAAFETQDNTNTATDTRLESVEADVTNLETSVQKLSETVEELSKSTAASSKSLRDNLDELIKQVEQNAVAIENIQRQLT